MAKEVKTVTPRVSEKRPKAGSIEDSIDVSINGPNLARMTLDKILSNENIDRVHKGHRILASSPKAVALKNLMKKESGNDRLGIILEGIIDGYYKKKENLD
jgi:hypothetical protein